MRKQEAEVLIDAIKKMLEPEAKGEARRSLDVIATAGGKATTEAIIPIASGNGPTRFSLNADEFERLYLRIKNRFIDDARIDPILLQLLTTRPELVVEVEPRIVTLDTGNLKGRVARLLANGFFSSSRATSAVRKELARTGADPGGGGSLSDVLGGYVRDGFLVREGDGYLLAPGVKVTERTVTAVS